MSTSEYWYDFVQLSFYPVFPSVAWTSAYASVKTSVPQTMFFQTRLTKAEVWVRLFLGNMFLFSDKKNKSGK